MASYFLVLDRSNGQGICWSASVSHATLQAHDWQAYQELLAKQKGPEGASERYEVINRFLDDTEDYLHKLAGKVASVKLSQEASEAAAQAMAEARAQVCYCLLATVIYLVPRVTLCFYACIDKHMVSSRLCICNYTETAYVIVGNPSSGSGCGSCI